MNVQFNNYNQFLSSVLSNTQKLTHTWCNCADCNWLAISAAQRAVAINTAINDVAMHSVNGKYFVGSSFAVYKIEKKCCKHAAYLDMQM